ncbi:MAG: glycerol kinase GlpK [Oscillibacter sp.]|jgi:glycerol kinase|nr:glycerol kinase GlpK [Oscillibacter sp.]
MKRYFLGIDQGTTGSTALLIDEQWQVIATKNVEHTQIYPKPGWVEHDPEEIWEAIQTAVAAVLKEAMVSPSQIVSIGIDNQGETCMVWDKHTGKPVHNALVWQDRRTAAYADELNEKYGKMITKKTGLGPDAYFSATKIKWILDNVEGVREKIKTGDILAGTLDSYLIWRFTGGKAFITDTSTASRTMMMDLKKGEWDQELLDIYNIPREILPKISNSSEVYGYTTPETFFGQRIPVAACITDALAAMLAQGCLDKGDIKTTYGTGCFMYINLGHEVVYSKGGLITVSSWQVNNEITYAFDGGVYIAGAAIQWLRDKLKIIKNSAETEKIALSVKDTGGVYFVPAFAGLAAPHWDQYARGMIIGITGGTTSDQIVRATLESIAFQVYDNAQVMKTDSGYNFATMKVDGGPVVNQFLMQFQADLLGTPVDVPVVTEMTAYGAAFLAALAVGEFNSINDVRKCWKLQRRYEPHMSKDERDERLGQWHRAVERCKNWEIPNRS